jgi:hypothetical protein
MIDRFIMRIGLYFEEGQDVPIFAFWNMETQESLKMPTNIDKDNLLDSLLIQMLISSRNTFTDTQK